MIKHFQAVKIEKSKIFFIFKLTLIILLNKTCAYVTQDIERILLPTLNPTSAKEIPLTLKTFGKQIHLNLRRNDELVSSTFKVWKHNAKGITEQLSQLNVSDSCYYYHKDHISAAAINFCHKHGWEGFIFLEDDTLEIQPLRYELASSSIIDNICVKDINISFGRPHLIKRSLQLSADSYFHNLDNFKLKRRNVRDAQGKLTIELAVFFDEAAYHTFMPFLDEDEKMLRMLILAYVNHLQTVFHLPSLGVSIDILLVYLEIMEKQPSNLPVSRTNSELLNSFCKYAKTRNSPDDNDPHHWDLGLYLTGINIHGRINESDILGTARKVGAICEADASCAIVEFGIAHDISSGFTSSIIAAHEIGHILGMDHDHLTSCNKSIMSANYDHTHVVTWSKCSRDKAKDLWNTKECLRDHTIQENFELDHSTHYHDLPGRKWTAKAQCEIFFRDKDANVLSLVDICKMLQCETPHENRIIYNTGQALEGTYCAPGKECRGGECVPVMTPPYILEYCEEDNWSEWQEEDTCVSKYLEKSKGVRVKRRSCKHKNHRTANCEGPYYDVVLCNDSMLCTEKRMTVSEFVSQKCNLFSEKSVQRTKKEKILQDSVTVNYVFEKSQACIIFCVLKDYTIYAPLLEMLAEGIDPYFPDGTFCYEEEGQNYYCRQHSCLPEN